MEKTTAITFRKNDNGKFLPIIRGGRSTIIIDNKKTNYNRQKEKQVNYEN
jgi:hypothetical protein